MNPPYASASLYVGDLANDVSEGLLYEVFNCVGPVASIRVCRDAITRRSLGYAYVNFHSVQDAERALDTLNNAPIKGKPCRIMWSQRDPSLRKSGVGNIFIKNLDKTIDHKSLYDTFSAFGNILSCKIVTDDINNSKGYGFVHFDTQEAADKAVSKVNGMILNNQQVFVGPFISQRERLRSGEAVIKFTNVYVKNIPESIKQSDIEDMFKQYGPVLNAVVMTDGQGKSKGFGFVNYQNHQDAQNAVNGLNGKIIDGKTLYVGRAQKKSERDAELRAEFERRRAENQAKYTGVNLYVKNLEDNIDSEKLREVFTPYGKIQNAVVMKDDKNNSRGFGFVCFSTPEEARAALEMNSRMLGSKPLYVALAQRKEVRRAQLEAQYAQRAKAQLARGPMVMQPGQIPNQMYPAPMMYQGMPAQGFVGYPQVVRGNRWNSPQYPPMNQGYGVVPGGNQRPHQAGRPPRGAGQKDNRQTQPGQRKTGGRQQPHAQQPAAAQPQQEAAAASEVDIQMFGEQLYRLIEQDQPTLAPKITGMILEASDPAELRRLLEDRTSLNAKVDEALAVLRAAGEQ